MEEDAADEGEADAQPGVLQRVDPLEVRRLVDGDVPVDRHEDDDVHRAGHERVDQGHLEVSLPERVLSNFKKQEGGHLVEGSGVVASAQSGGDVKEGGDGRDESAQVGHCQAQQVDVHHSLQHDQQPTQNK